jgi:hypothetical protein
MREFFRIMAYAIFAGILAVIIFVRPSELGGESGGNQASKIINSTTKGFASIIAAAQGRNMPTT